MLIKATVFTVLFFAGNLFAQEQQQPQQPDRCDRVYKNIGQHSFHRWLSNDGKTCYLSVLPSNAYTNLVYRSFSFSTSGQLMVFNSFNDTTDPKATAARVFYFFPRNRHPNFRETQNSIIVETATQGLEFEISKTTGKVIGNSWGSVSEADEVEPYNQGGIEIFLNQGVMLDSGFKVGSDPTSNPSAKSTYKNGLNQNCSFYNKQLFSYLNDGDVELDKTDQELALQIQKACPKFVL